MSQNQVKLITWFKFLLHVQARKLISSNPLVHNKGNISLNVMRKSIWLNRSSYFTIVDFSFCRHQSTSVRNFLFSPIHCRVFPFFQFIDFHRKNIFIIHAFSTKWGNKRKHCVHARQNAAVFDCFAHSLLQARVFDVKAVNFVCVYETANCRHYVIQIESFFSLCAVVFARKWTLIIDKGKQKTESDKKKK